MTKRKKAKNSPTPSARGIQHSATFGEAEAAVAPGTSGTAALDPEATQFALSAECLIGAVGTLQQSLARLLEEPRPITLDTTALERIDTAALQVLTAFVRERTGHGHLVEWQGVAPALTSAAQLLGLTSLLRLPA